MLTGENFQKLLHIVVLFLQLQRRDSQVRTKNKIELLHRFNDELELETWSEGFSMIWRNHNFSSVVTLKIVKVVSTRSKLKRVITYGNGEFFQREENSLKIVHTLLDLWEGGFGIKEKAKSNTTQVLPISRQNTEKENY